MTAAEAFPKMLYGPNGLTTVVGSSMEQDALGLEWGEVPQDRHLALIAAQGPLVPPAPAASPASPLPVASAPVDMNALAEHVALRVAEILAPMLPKRTGRPPNSERQESLDG